MVRHLRPARLGSGHRADQDCRHRGGAVGGRLTSIPGAAQLAADEINAHGGVDGRKIEITTYDNHSSAADSVRAFQRAVSEDPRQCGDRQLRQ